MMKVQRLNTPVQTLEEWVAKYRGLATRKKSNRSKTALHTQIGMPLETKETLVSQGFWL